MDRIKEGLKGISKGNKVKKEGKIMKDSHSKNPTPVRRVRKGEILEKVIAVMLSIMMIFGSMPTSIFAADLNDEEVEGALKIETSAKKDKKDVVEDDNSSKKDEKSDKKDDKKLKKGAKSDDVDTSVIDDIDTDVDTDIKDVDTNIDDDLDNPIDTDIKDDIKDINDGDLDTDIDSIDGTLDKAPRKSTKAKAAAKAKVVTGSGTPA